MATLNSDPSYTQSDKILTLRTACAQITKTFENMPEVQPEGAEGPPRARRTAFTFEQLKEAGEVAHELTELIHEVEGAPKQLNKNKGRTIYRAAPGVTPEELKKATEDMKRATADLKRAAMAAKAEIEMTEPNRGLSDGSSDEPEPNKAAKAIKAEIEMTGPPRGLGDDTEPNKVAKNAKAEIVMTGPDSAQPGKLEYAARRVAARRAARRHTRSAPF